MSDNKAVRDEDGAGMRHLGRREFLGGLGALGAASLLAACGGSSKSSSSGSGSGNTGTSQSSSSAPVTSADLSADEIVTLKKMVGPIDPKYSGQGKTWNIGGAWALTGPLVYYFTIQGDGLKLAAKHISQLGGPSINLSVQNVGSPQGVDPLLAQNVALAWKSAGVGSAVTFDYDAGGTLIPFVQKYQIFSIDPGAGVGSFEGKDYFWGMRGLYPQNYLAQGCKYLRKKNSKLSTVSIVYYTGGQYTGLNTAIKNQIEAAGFRVIGNANSQEGSTDFSSAIATLRSQNPDIVVLGSSGNDAAYFLKDYATSGLHAPVMGDSFSAPQAEVGGSAFNGSYVVQENFVPNSPTNDWASIFVKHYRAAYGNQGGTDATSPLNLSAAYYNVGFVLWELARRVLAKGGDLNDGAAIQSALFENLTFPSIFGGSGLTPGSMTFDTTTHGLAHEPIGIFQVTNGALKLVGTADSGGGPVTVVA